MNPDSSGRIPLNRIVAVHALRRACVPFTAVVLGALLTACHIANDRYVAADGRSQSCRYNAFGGLAVVNAREANRVCDQTLRAAGYVRDGATGSVGIAELSRTRDGLRIDRVVDGSPAQRAGLHEGDVLTGIDGQMVSGTQDAFHRLFGEAGMPVTIDYHPDGDRIRHLRLIRQGDAAASRQAPVARPGPATVPEPSTRPEPASRPESAPSEPDAR